jgi:alkylation response protein AidB-like acyl-CoA dehydrogenase
MEFELNEVQRRWNEGGTSLGRSLDPATSAADVMAAAARAGLLAPDIDLLSVVVAVDALASGNPAAAVCYALHSALALSLPEDDARRPSLLSGARVGALTLATDVIPEVRGETLTGGASWVAPITGDGLALLGARRDDALVACAVDLDHPSVTIQAIPTAALGGLTCGHVRLDATPFRAVGSTIPVMSRGRILLAAVGLGIGRRAVQEALGSVRGKTRGPGGEQGVQGLVADAATEIDAALLLTWKAATAPLSLADASMAKLAAASAARRAVERATEAVGADSFTSGHRIEQLAQDVRALELFAGRTEALREAVAEGVLPRSGSGSRA